MWIGSHREPEPLDMSWMAQYVRCEDSACVERLMTLARARAEQLKGMSLEELKRECPNDDCGDGVGLWLRD